jgi:hypothetical protein
LPEKKTVEKRVTKGARCRTANVVVLGPAVVGLAPDIPAPKRRKTTGSWSITLSMHEERVTKERKETKQKRWAQETKRWPWIMI